MYVKSEFLLYFFCVSEVFTYNLQISDGNSKATTTIDLQLNNKEILESYSEFEKKLFEAFLKEKAEMERNAKGVMTDKEAFDSLVTKRNLIISTEPTEEDTSTNPPIESWSVVWYIASFSGLIAFFLVVSCSEWCCRRNGRGNNTLSPTLNSPNQASTSLETPPPSYDLFAPPSYDSLCYGRNGEKSEYDIYVVPIHALGSIMEGTMANDSPPPYAISREYGLPMERRQMLPNDHHVAVT